VLAWSIEWYESRNLWDYLLDPLLFIYVITRLVHSGTQGIFKSSRQWMNFFRKWLLKRCSN